VSAFHLRRAARIGLAMTGENMPSENPYTLLDVISCCTDAVRKYAALRTELFQQLMRLPSGWGLRYRRDSTQGEPLLPPRVTQHTATISELGGQPFEGIAAFTMLETYAPFSEFEVLSPDGKRATSGTEPAILEMRLGFLLRELLDNMKVLAGSLAIIEREAGPQRWSTDTTPLSHLAEELPVFPYWPKIDRRSKSYFDGILAEEKPRLDAARLSLRLLTVEESRRQSAPKTAAAVVNAGKVARRKPPRRRRTATDRPLTALQTQAMELYGTQKGKIGEVARSMGISDSTANQHIDAAHRKLGDALKRKIATGKAKHIPTDRRGQPTISDQARR
jgi:predicted DNA-binding protein (UPF0251 family)